MKRAICAALVACSIVALAEDQQQPAAPAAEPTAPPAAEQSTTPWLLGDRLKRPLDSAIQIPDGSVVKAVPYLPSGMLGGTCYFIRTLRPVLPESDAKRSGFIPLQAHITGTVSEPVCANGGRLRPLVPVSVQKVAAEPAARPATPAGDKASP